MEQIIASWTRTVTRFEAMETLTDLGILASQRFWTTVKLLEVPHLKAREMIVDVHDATRGDY